MEGSKGGVRWGRCVGWERVVWESGEGAVSVDFRLEGGAVRGCRADDVGWWGVKSTTYPKSGTVLREHHAV
ncbi:hypothetical protein M758_UG173100 [Ceratodon purpureus]|nr:hypothetical protein M758_UG173100 [Ceratodon purpureus]